jgi:hypothetical protein
MSATVWLWLVPSVTVAMMTAAVWACAAVEKAKAVDAWVAEVGPRFLAVVHCPHTNRVPVTLLTGEVVRQICIDCDGELPPEFGCPDCESVEIFSGESADPIATITASRCGKHGGDE